MAKKLFILLNKKNHDQPQWLLVNDQNKKIEISFLSPADIEESEVSVFVPTQDILLTEATLPKVSSTKLMKALPYALEENVAEDVSKLHFAVGKMKKNKKLPIAVVAKEKMNDWRLWVKQFLQTPNFYLKGIYPDVFLLPFRQETWTLMNDEARVLGRMELENGFAIERNQLKMVLNVLLKQPETIYPSQVVTVGAVHLDADEASYFQQLNIPLTETSQNSLLNLAIQSPNLPINLLQGSYSAHFHFMQNKKLYPIAAALVGVLLFVLTLGELGQLFLLKHYADQTHREMLAQVKTILPIPPTSNRAIKDRIQAEITSLSSNAESPFLRIMNRIAPLVAKNNGISLMGLEFNDKQLTLDLSSADFTQMDALTQSLKQENLKFEQKDAKKVGNTIQTNLLIQE